MRAVRPLIACICAVAALMAGCASGGEIRVQAGAAPPDSLSTYIGKLRQLSNASAVRPAPTNAVTLESHDPDLRKALQALREHVNAEAHRGVADAYHRAGVLSQAYRHYAAALALNKRDAAAHDGLARVWRDWGTPALGLPDALRAIYYAPRSAEAHNTLGTLLHALGRAREATRAFERSTSLDPGAAYAWTNRCYVSLQTSHVDSALAECRHALALDPQSRPARNNLALVYAATGDLARAGSQFAADGDAVRQFNMGIVLSARRDYAAAAAAFEAAHALNPAWGLAAQRASQAQRLRMTLQEPAQ